MRSSRHVAGWDVGGVNTKVAHVDGGRIVSVCGRPFELQRAPDRLVPLLRELAFEAGCPLEGADTAHAVTMTAELSQMFRTKREGVAFVIDAIEHAFPLCEIRVFTVDGRFLTPAEARAEPLAVAAANWSATARLVALDYSDALLIDIGTTTTDIIPIAGGLVAAKGRTDPERLASGELVYTGALRTPAEAILSEVALGADTVGVSAEGFALAGDAHLWRGDLDPADYTVPTPDRRPAIREFAGERLARVVCADREMLDDSAISELADALADAQVQRIATAIRQVMSRHPSLDAAVVTGLGAFLAEAAARVAGLKVVPLASALGAATARVAPAAAVGLLFDRGQSTRTPVDAISERPGASSDVRGAMSDIRGAVSDVRGAVSDLRDGGSDVRGAINDVRGASSDVRGAMSDVRSAASDVRSGGNDVRGGGNDVRGGGNDVRGTVSDVPEAISKPHRVETVIKIGGGVLAQADCLDRVLSIVASAARDRRLLLVPGGGPFADAVRSVDRRIRLSDDAAHWMAVLAMDQYAHLLAERLACSALVTNVREAKRALDAGRVPVLAPSRWLQEADPLPHSWEVTSDSIAAWVAGAVGARQLVLVKPSGAVGAGLIDSYFSRTLPGGVGWTTVAADQPDAFGRLLHRD
jgi:probable H4MPT-linked C1 transfer pathway protein